jgi:hypothetical protein
MDAINCSYIFSIFIEVIDHQLLQSSMEINTDYAQCVVSSILQTHPRFHELKLMLPFLQPLFQHKNYFV